MTGSIKGLLFYILRFTIKERTIVTARSRADCWPKILDLLQRRRESWRGDTTVLNP